MSAAHTPGPWMARTTSGSVGTADKLVAVAYGDDPECKVDSLMVANARLIAAAPDLLVALQVMLRDYAAVHDIGDVEMQPAIYQARAAIVKATGGQP